MSHLRSSPEPSSTTPVVSCSAQSAFSRLHRRTSFIYPQSILSTFPDPLVSFCSTSTHLCNCLISRFCTTLHAKKLFFLQPSFSLFPPPASSRALREFHASKRWTSPFQADPRTALKPAWYLVCTANVKFFSPPLQSTFVSFCRTSLAALRHCHFLFCGYGSLWLTKDGGL